MGDLFETFWGISGYLKSGVSMYFSDAMAYNQQAQQYVLAAQMQHAGQVVQQAQQQQQAQQVPKQEPVANALAHAAQQQAQTIAEQQHQAAAALELSNAAAAAP